MRREKVKKRDPRRPHRNQPAKKKQKMETADETEDPPEEVQKISEMIESLRNEEEKTRPILPPGENRDKKTEKRKMQKDIRSYYSPARKRRKKKEFINEKGCGSMENGCGSSDDNKTELGSGNKSSGCGTAKVETDGEFDSESGSGKWSDVKPGKIDREFDSERGTGCGKWPSIEFDRVQSDGGRPNNNEVDVECDSVGNGSGKWPGREFDNDLYGSFESLEQNNLNKGLGREFDSVEQPNLAKGLVREFDKVEKKQGKEPNKTRKKRKLPGWMLQNEKNEEITDIGCGKWHVTESECGPGEWSGVGERPCREVGRGTNNEDNGCGNWSNRDSGCGTTTNSFVSGCGKWPGL